MFFEAHCSFSELNTSIHNHVFSISAGKLYYEFVSSDRELNSSRTRRSETNLRLLSLLAKARTSRSRATTATLSTRTRTRASKRSRTRTRARDKRLNSNSQVKSLSPSPKMLRTSLSPTTRMQRLRRLAIRRISLSNLVRPGPKSPRLKSQSPMSPIQRNLSPRTQSLKRPGQTTRSPRK